MSTYLVTGAAGFIGSHIVDRLLGEGHRVVALDNFNESYSPRFKESNLVVHHHNPYFTLYRGDITDASALERIFSHHEIDGVIHMAARPGVRASFEHPKEYEHNNVLGTQTVFEAAHRFGNIPVVYASSSTVYGNNERIPFLEDDAYRHKALSPYGETKRETERIAARYAKKGVPSIGLRFFSIYGERTRPDLALYLFTAGLLQGKPLPVFGTGAYKRDFTHVHDAVDAVMASLGIAGSCYNELVNVGNDRPVGIMDVIGLLEEFSGQKAQLRFMEPHPGDAKINCADLTKAQAVLNFKPRVPLEEGLRRFVQWFKHERMV